MTSIEDRLRDSWVFVFVVSLVLVAGCGEHDEPAGLRKKVIELDKVPAAALAAAAKTLPEVKLQDAWENVDAEGKLHSYEIRGLNPKSGKIREVRVSHEGKVLEVE
jgi:uncharacterized protein YcfL